MTCGSCKIPMESLGQIPIRTEGIMHLDVYRCPRCKRVEMFDLDLSLPALQ
jgi:phage FluMu protein Com